MPGEVDGSRDPMSREQQVLAEIDRELAAALSVTPSADFEARVLQRVDEGETPHRWRSPWLAAAASLVLAAGLFYAVSRAPAIDDVPPRPIATNRPDVVLPAPEAVPVVRPVERPHPSAAVSVRRPARAAEPEVIVVNQMEAVRRLVRAVNEGRLDPPAEPLQGPVAPPAELAVDPLVIEPIPVPALEPDPQVPPSDIRRTH